MEHLEKILFDEIAIYKNRIKTLKKVYKNKDVILQMNKAKIRALKRVLKKLEELDK